MLRREAKRIVERSLTDRTVNSDKATHKTRYLLLNGSIMWKSTYHVVNFL